MRFVGIDGCPSGWIAVAWDGSGSATAYFLPRLEALPSLVPDAAVVAIDIPIVIPEAARSAEAALRSFLGPRRSSVFATPPQAAMDADDYASANRAARAATGKGISRQAWALVPKIREAVAWIPEAGIPVIEAHPEGCFAALLGAPASASKKTWAGMTQRLGALTAAGFELSDIDETAARAALTDDLLDAAVTAWTAARFHRGEARSFPPRPNPLHDVIWA